MTPFSATLRSEWTKLSSLRSTKVMLAFSLRLRARAERAAGARGRQHLGRLEAGRPPRLRADRGRADRPAGQRDPVPRDRRQGRDGRVRRGHDAPHADGDAAARAGARGEGARRRARSCSWPRLVCNVAMFLLARAILSSYGIDDDGPHATATRCAPCSARPRWRRCSRSSASRSGSSLRSTAATIIAVLAVIFGPPFLGGVLPQSWQGDALEYVPDVGRRTRSRSGISRTRAPASPPRSPRSSSPAGSRSSSAARGRCSNGATRERDPRLDSRAPATRGESWGRSCVESWPRRRPWC